MREDFLPVQGGREEKAYAFSISFSPLRGGRGFALPAVRIYPARGAREIDGIGKKRLTPFRILFSPLRVGRSGPLKPQVLRTMALKNLAVLENLP